MLLRVGQGKTTISCSKIKLHRIIVAEHLPPIEPLANIVENDGMRVEVHETITDSHHILCDGYSIGNSLSQWRIPFCA